MTEGAMCRTRMCNSVQRTASWCRSVNFCATVLLSFLVASLLCYLLLSNCLGFYHYVFGTARKSQFKPRRDFLTFYPDPINGPTSRDHQPDVTSRKLVLLWTPFYKTKDWVNPTIVYADKKRELSCTFTSNKSLVDQSDALIFHPPDFKSHQPFPAKRQVHQRYILYSMEPPYYNFIFVMSRYNYVFNWTMTVRQDSDVQIHYGGNVQHLPSKSEKENKNILEEIGQKSKSKTKMAVARISNCLSLHSHRMDLIRQLQKYISLDFYGFCGKECPPHSCEAKMGEYKFFMSFENGLCRDYVTEKALTPLSRFNAVPVVLGAAHPDEYTRALPPQSYINVEDFTSVKSLASYLKMLDSNDSLYQEFFHWKLTHTFGGISRWEMLCKDLHNTSKPVQVYSDLEGWFLEDTCHYSELHAIVSLWPFVVIFLFPIMLIIHFLSRKYGHKRIVVLVILTIAVGVVNIIRAVVFRVHF